MHVADKPGLVYFAACGEYVKVGFSTDPTKRLSHVLSDFTLIPEGIDRSYTVDLIASFPGTPYHERYHHSRISSHRVEGTREWYYRTPDVLSYIQSVRAFPPGEMEPPSADPKTQPLPKDQDGRILCPCCSGVIPDELFRSEAARLQAARRKTTGGPQRVMRKCPRCGQQLGAREMRQHFTECARRPEK